MLRSFDYAMHAALRQAAPRAESHAGLALAGPAWREAPGAPSSTATMRGRGRGPASPHDEAHGLLELFLLEKALYELATRSTTARIGRAFPCAAWSVMPGPGQ